MQHCDLFFPGLATDDRSVCYILIRDAPDFGHIWKGEGMNKHSRMLIMQSLPVKTADEINDMIEHSDKHYIDLFPLSQTREAQQRILNPINKTVDKF